MRCVKCGKKFRSKEQICAFCGESRKIAQERSRRFQKKQGLREGIVTCIGIIGILGTIFYYKTILPSIRDNDSKAKKVGSVRTSVNDYRKGDLNSYVFEVPRTWEVGGPTEEERVRQMLGIPQEYKINALSTFSMPEGAVVTIYELTVPLGKGATYIDSLFELNAETFRVGSSSGLVKEVVENRKTKLGDFDALLVDWVSNRGGLPHSRQWVLHPAGQSSDNIAVIVAFCSDHGYKPAKEAMDRMASTLRVKNAN